MPDPFRLLNLQKGHPRQVGGWVVNVFYQPASLQVHPRLTKRALDRWDSSPFSTVFLASDFSCSRTESTPAQPRLLTVYQSR